MRINILIWSLWNAFWGTFSPVSSTNKTDRHELNEMLFKVTLYFGEHINI